MSFDSRFGWMLMGCIIGFMCGYIVRSLRELKDQVEQVEQHVKEKSKDEGFVRNALVLDMALILVIALTVWASFSSQKSSNDVKNTQATLTNITICNQQYLSKTISALNSRTQYSQQQADANVDLQQAQFKFLTTIINRTTHTDAERQKQSLDYLDALQRYLTLAGKSSSTIKDNPYPTNAELATCLSRK